MDSMLETVDVETTFVLSDNNNHRLDTFMFAFLHVATGTMLDFDVAWDFPQCKHYILQSAHWMRFILMSRNARWPGFIYVIWLFEMVAGVRNDYQLHNQWRVDGFSPSFSWFGFVLCWKTNCW